MKSLIYTCVIVFCWLFNHLSAQNQLGTVAFSLVMPDEIENLDQNQLLKLESKIIAATSESAIAGKGYFSDFLIYPVITFGEFLQQNQNMQKQYAVNLDLGLFIKSTSDGRIYSSFSKSIVGIGSSQTNAVSNALNSFDPKSKEIALFFEDAIKKITSYYNVKCTDFISLAESNAKMGKYDESIAILMSIPKVSSECSEKIKNKSIEIYREYLNSTCKTLILSSEAFLADGQVDKALEKLLLIDVESECYKEAREIIKRTKNDLDAKASKDFDLKMNQYENELELEKIRLNSIKEIALSYYSNYPRFYNYFEIVPPK